MITDEEMRETLAKARPYVLVLLRATPKRQDPDAGPVIWEHGRRNMGLRNSGVLPIVCPVTDDSEWSGIGIFDAPVEEVVRMMEEDPGVEAGIFTYEVHPVRGFPGSRLPD